MVKNTTESEFIGTYQIRPLGHGEVGIHAPVTVTGKFDLYLDKDGTLRYVPMRR
jgi:hypothetical protein